MIFQFQGSEIISHSLPVWCLLIAMGAKGVFYVPWDAAEGLWGASKDRNGCRSTALEDHQDNWEQFAAGSGGKFPISWVKHLQLHFRAKSSFHSLWTFAAAAHPSECLTPGKKKRCEREKTGQEFRELYCKVKKNEAGQK